MSLCLYSLCYIILVYSPVKLDGWRGRKNQHINDECTVCWDICPFIIIYYKDMSWVLWVRLFGMWVYELVGVSTWYDGHLLVWFLIGCSAIHNMCYYFWKQVLQELIIHGLSFLMLRYCCIIIASISYSHRNIFYSSWALYYW